MIGTDHFRFLSLTKDQADMLKEFVKNVEIDKHYETGMYVGSIELIDTRVVIEINEFRKKIAVAVTDCDVFISIASNRRDEVWRAPMTVNYIVNIVNCPVVFSYTC